ncbi:S41 family peptidase [Mucilaginibacter pocheonensis]|uniref:C-terminal processing protease CtpA/Prc n=1 Tax=Mucilaginibacter pocheonensis TaxID=398050 RepID=A0ABU1TG70_9SPHI|nr:S41 family peptidase [Mucilaginibacter pocheonensis]MDR6944246.1 C-terminal processing protease CtpA/Prc [Mucilaginibacter pocheonensis]
MSISILQSSCKKDKPAPNYPPGSNENVNTWTLDSLRRYYYWSDGLPANPALDRAPQDFFSAMRNASDRFSYILLPGDPSTVSITNRSQYGFDYTTIKEKNTGLVFGVVKLVLNDSPASRSGLKRGDYISKINGKAITQENAAALQQELLSGTQVTITLAELSGNELKDTGSVGLTAGFTFEQPAVSSIIDNGGSKTAYLYIYDFSPGLAASLYNIFMGFKNAAVTELILDLRYNSGGQVAEAAGVCAMIASGMTYNTPFITYKGNKNGGTRSESLGDAASFDHTLNFNALLQSNLNLKRIFILATGATASASEVMVNNLKPYIQVVLIGERTRGKDEASFKIADARVPKQVEWEMHPIVYKLFNAAGSGGYSGGIDPDIKIVEFDNLPLQSFGTWEDPLVKAALDKISGKSIVQTRQLKPSGKGGFAAQAILADSRAILASASTVITHR